LLFTKTIQRKMLFMISLILVMLVILSAILGLSLISYKTLISDLNQNLKVLPNKTDIFKATNDLNSALRAGIVRKDEPSLIINQDQNILFCIRTAKEASDDFLRKINSLSPSVEYGPQRKSTDREIISKISLHFERLENNYRAIINTPIAVNKRNISINYIRSGLLDMYRFIGQINDYQTGLTKALFRAKKVYATRMWWVLLSSFFTAIAFLGLICIGYLSVYKPLRVLHEGARRVAQGNLDYRLEITTHDEMGELADSFNQMTERFQEIKQDLDMQVRERSKQLVRSERLAGIGLFSAGIAHEINNPISAISMAAESLLSRSLYNNSTDEKDDDTKVSEQYLSMIQRESDRCQKFTQRLLHFARGDDGVKREHDLIVIVEEVLSIIQPMSKFKDRKILFSHGLNPCMMKINGGEIKQVVLNLVANALESMSSGGTLKISIQEQTDIVTIKLIDDGCGMEKEVIERLFDPFFTRRKDGKGTGLGMSISQRIIGEHGGSIEAKSDGPEQGSTFHVRIPRIPAEQGAAA
jgi:two-component system, NtrC family, sensor kinase